MISAPLVLGVRRNLKVDGEALFLENTLALNKMVAEPIVVNLFFCFGLSTRLSTLHVLGHIMTTN